QDLIATFSNSDLKGTMLIAGEGVNGTMAGTPATIERLLSFLTENVGLSREEVKFSVSNERPFKRLKFRIKLSIIAFRKAEVDPTRAGKYVQPQEWNALLEDTEVLVL